MSEETKSLDILLIEDNEFDRLSINRTFSKSGIQYTIIECERAEEAVELIEKGEGAFNIVVIDYRLPGMSGLELLKRILGKKLQVPVVMLTGSGSEQVAVESLKIGAYDYIIKDPYGGYLDLLPLVLMDVRCKYSEYIAGRKAEALVRLRDAELRLKNEQLEKLNSLKSEMLAIISHDLRVPLNAMVGYAEILKKKIARVPKEEVEDYLNKIIENGYRMASFVRDILDLKRIDDYKFQPELKPARLDNILKSCVDMNSIAAQNKKLKIELEILGKPAEMMIDPIRMEQVFNNILSNAIKFSPEGGEIFIRYKEKDNKTFTLSVKDQGPGIPEESLEAIFSKYYQAESKGKDTNRVYGMGFGLYISKEIIKLHNGKIWVENLPEQGCVFYIEIPIKRAE